MNFRFLNSSKFAKTVSIIVFIVFVIVGLLSYRDYAISIDEPIHRMYSIVTYRWVNRTLFDRGVFINEGTEDLGNFEEKYYGVAIQLPLLVAEDIYQMVKHEPMPVRSIYHMRHIYFHLIYILSLYCFFCLTAKIFHSDWAGILAVLMIYSFGRFFAESFYNTMDTVFASLCMISFFCAYKVLSAGCGTKWCLIFAVVTAFTVSSRMAGAMIPLGLMVLILMDRIRYRQPFPWKPFLLIAAAYPIWILITPASWTNPLKFSFEFISAFSDYHWNGVVLFEGKYLWKEEVPADYWLRWIGMTVPLVYQVFAVIGLFLFVRHIFKIILNKSNVDVSIQNGARGGLATCAAKPTQACLSPCASLGSEQLHLYYDTTDKILLIMFVLFTGSLLYQIICHPTVYNSWRHGFYLYPLLITFAVYALLRLKQWKMRTGVICTAVTSLSLVYHLILLVVNHPAQYTAFNLIGQRFADQYEGDYWGMSVFQCLNWILDQGSEPVTVSPYYPRTKGMIYNDLNMLTDEEQERISVAFVDSDYQIVLKSGNGIFEYEANPEIEGYTEVYPVMSYGSEIASVYQKTGQP